MPKQVFFIDNVFNIPHGPITIAKNAQKHTWSLENLLGHFDHFPLKDFYNLKNIDLFSKDIPKYIVAFIQMPVMNTPYLSQEAVHLLKTRNDIKLLVLSTLEHVIKPKELSLSLSKKSIPLDRVLVMCSNLEAHGQVLEGVRYISINFWESFSRMHIKILPGASIITPEDRLKTYSKANKKFLCLNRNVKPHRIWFYYSIIKSHMLDQGHVSYHLPSIDKSSYDFILQKDWVFKRIPIELHNDFREICKRKMFTRKLDVIDRENVINYNAQNNIITDFYHDSCMSFVTESESTSNFITEKTYKAIANLHPFFIVGNPDQHALLRARGYYTFEDLFESQKITNYVEAIDCLEKLKIKDLQELKRLIEQKYFDKLIHNQQNFLNRDISWNTIVEEINKAFAREI